MDKAHLPVCIAGMHRSGTSMVARLLNLCGLYLGEPDELLPAAADNTEGYWENTHFVALNNALLEYSGGTWDMPPPRVAGWAQQPELAAIHQQAVNLIGRLQTRGSWGWKDPRNSITLPFWQSIIPGLKAVICLRHPHDVATSLHFRNQSSPLFGLTLWLAYNQSLLEATRPQDRVITHYDAYFEDPARELRRVLSLLGWPVSDDVIQQACAAVSPANRHHDARSVAPPPFAKPLSDLYEQMQAEADRTIEVASSSSETGSTPPGLEGDLNIAQSIRQTSYALMRETALEQAKVRITSLETQNESLGQEITRLGNLIDQMQVNIEQMQAHLEHVQNLERVASREVAALHNAKFYKLAARFWKWRNWIMGRS